MSPRSLALLLIVTALSGCAGFRGGWESVPYVGEVPPAFEPSSSAYDSNNRPELELPGLTLGVSLSNRMRTYDTKVYFFVVPLEIDPRSVYTQEVGPGKTRVYLRVVPREEGWIFRPREARLTIGGQTHAAETGYEFGMWNDTGERVAEGGRWDHRDVGSEFRLPEAGRTYLLSVDVPVQSPSPESRGIMLDLSSALLRPGTDALPVIRFAPVRWKEGYT